MKSAAAGFVDPTLTPTSARERKFIAEVIQRGYTLTRVPGSAHAVRLVGPGVYVTAAALHLLVPADFAAPRLKADAQ